jgi:hypothetical protein
MTVTVTVTVTLPVAVTMTLPLTVTVTVAAESHSVHPVRRTPFRQRTLQLLRNAHTLPAKRQLQQRGARRRRVASRCRCLRRARTRVPNRDTHAGILCGGYRHVRSADHLRVPRLRQQLLRTRLVCKWRVQMRHHIFRAGLQRAHAAIKERRGASNRSVVWAVVLLRLLCRHSRDIVEPVLPRHAARSHSML